MSTNIENLLSTLLSNNLSSREILPSGPVNYNYNFNDQLVKSIKDEFVKKLQSKGCDIKTSDRDKLHLPSSFHDDLIKLLKAKGFDDVKILNGGELQFTNPSSLHLPTFSFDAQRAITPVSTVQTPPPLPPASSPQSQSFAPRQSQSQSYSQLQPQTAVNVASNFSPLHPHPQSQSHSQLHLQPQSSVQMPVPISMSMPLPMHMSVSIPTTMSMKSLPQAQQHQSQMSVPIADPVPAIFKTQIEMPGEAPILQQISQSHVNHRKSKRPRSTQHAQNNNGQNQSNNTNNSNNLNNNNTTTNNINGFGKVVSAEIKSENQTTTSTIGNKSIQHHQSHQSHQSRHKTSKQIFFRIYKSSNSNLPGIPIQIWKDEVQSQFVISFLAPGFSKDECSIRMIECENSKKSVWKFIISCEKHNCDNNSNKENSNNNNNNNNSNNVKTTNEINPQENKTAGLTLGPISELPFTSRSVTGSKLGLELSELQNYHPIHLGFSSPQKIYQEFDLEVTLNRERNIGCLAPVNGKFTFFIPYSPPLTPSFVNIEYIN